MSDLEIVKACAQAMGISCYETDKRLIVAHVYGPGTYDPLHDDAQAMELIKRFRAEQGKGS